MTGSTQDGDVRERVRYNKLNRGIKKEEHELYLERFCFADMIIMLFFCLVFIYLFIYLFVCLFKIRETERLADLAGKREKKMPNYGVCDYNCNAHFFFS
jgi:hypothetical protein